MTDRENGGDGGDGRDRAPVLELRGVHTSYGPVRVLADVSIEVRGGEIVCLLGSNAAGKTTTLRTILGLVTP
ncbi:MAG: ATP-binding cassette domain-containing protein, partial [Actinobacteria bacterium]|nr:ATP-binding cassette domain-containing protein [Actinomycetota bacterium]